MSIENPNFTNETNPKESELENARLNLENTSDRLGFKIDENIKESVAVLNVSGFNTSQSCEGHVERGIAAPWISIAAPNEPEERFEGENEIIKSTARKYQITED